MPSCKAFGSSCAGRRRSARCRRSRVSRVRLGVQQSCRSCHVVYARIRPSSFSRLHSCPCAVGKLTAQVEELQAGLGAAQQAEAAAVARCEQVSPPGPVSQPCRSTIVLLVCDMRMHTAAYTMLHHPLPQTARHLAEANETVQTLQQQEAGLRADLDQLSAQLSAAKESTAALEAEVQELLDANTLLESQVSHRPGHLCFTGTAAQLMLTSPTYLLQRRSRSCAPRPLPAPPTLPSLSRRSCVSPRRCAPSLRTRCAMLGASVPVPVPPRWPESPFVSLGACALRQRKLPVLICRACAGPGAHAADEQRKRAAPCSRTRACRARGCPRDGPRGAQPVAS